VTSGGKASAAAGEGAGGVIPVNLLTVTTIKLSRLEQNV